MKETAKELGKSSGAALGAGMVLIPQIMQPTGPEAVPSVTVMICPNCNARIPATSKFCLECGTKLERQTTATKNCPKCGKSIPATSKFCPECGEKFT
jgi:predicted amidophosphoribosyltransferase